MTPGRAIMTATAILEHKLWVTWHRSSPKCHVVPSANSHAVGRSDDLHEAVDQAVENLRTMERPSTKG